MTLLYVSWKHLGFIQTYYYVPEEIATQVVRFAMALGSEQTSTRSLLYVGLIN